MTFLKLSPGVSRLPALCLIAIGALAIDAAPLRAQSDTANQPTPAATTVQASPASFSGSDQNLTTDQLMTLVGPVALYPDDLLAIVLPASTQPIQLVEAQRLLDQRKSDPKAAPPKSWDPSIVALLNYPEVVALMNKDLTWTEQLGTAVINQQQALMDTIQAFRAKAQSAGNLKSDDKQKITVENKTIVIQSADPQVVYVPTYNPTTVVYAPAPGYPPPYTYSAPYPYYYSPAATFFTGAVFGAAIGYAIGWNDHGIYHGDVNINNNVNVNRNSNNTNINRNNFNRANLTNNHENAWRPSSSAINQGQARRANGGGLNGGAGRPAVSPGQISQGLAQRRTGQGTNGAAGALANRGANGGNRQNLSGATRGGGNLANRATGNRAAINRPAAGGGNFANRSGGAFAGANNSGLANRASARGNQSLGQSSFQPHASGGGQARSAPAARGGGGGGGRRR